MNFLHPLIINHTTIYSYQEKSPMKNLHLPPGDASLLAQLLLARGDPDALGAGGETVPWGPQRGNGGTMVDELPIVLPGRTWQKLFFMGFEWDYSHSLMGFTGI